MTDDEQRLMSIARHIDRNSLADTLVCALVFLFLMYLGGHVLAWVLR